jgi:hypothetical protein
MKTTNPLLVLAENSSTFFYWANTKSVFYPKDKKFISERKSLKGKGFTTTPKTT